MFKDSNFLPYELCKPLAGRPATKVDGHHYWCANMSHATIHRPHFHQLHVKQHHSQMWSIGKLVSGTQHLTILEKIISHGIDTRLTSTIQEFVFLLSHLHAHGNISNY